MTASVAGKTPDTARHDQPLSAAEYVALFADHARLIVAVTIVAALLAVAYAALATPVYKTNAMIQVEEKTGGLAGLGELTTLLTGNTPTDAEIEILRSRSVLGNTIAAENLAIEARPFHFPLIGAAVARAYDGDGPAPAWLGLSRYAWGGENIRVDRLMVPNALLGEALTMVAGDDDRYTVEWTGRTLLEGAVGEAAEGNGVSLFVSRLEARPGTHFSLLRRNWLDTLEDLESRLAVSERGRQTGIIQLSLQGRDPGQIAATLNSIADSYLRQNIERSSADAAKTLEFLNQQLPRLKTNLDAAEAALNQYRTVQGSVDLSLETQGLLAQIAEVEKQVSELELREAELGQRFTAQHPVMVALLQQRTELAATRENLQVQVRQLPAAEQVSLRLMRDVQVANELYMLLLNRAQELKVVQAGAVGNVRIIDRAFVPVQPFSPRPVWLATTGTVLGFALACLFVFLRESLNTTVREPEDLERIVDLPVYAIVPHSPAEEKLHPDSSRKEHTAKLLLQGHPEDPAIESLRSLRTSLEFLLLDVPTNVVTVGGPVPDAGKSFVTSNLAALFEQTGRRVLLIDADLRRGHLHRLFDVARKPGLTELISSEVNRQAAVVNPGYERLQLLPTGTLPPNPAEMISSPRFEALLSEIRSDYDLVFIDAPPVLGAAEAVSLARLSSVNLLVIRSGRQGPREVRLALDKLQQVSVTPNGFILNDLHLSARRYSYAGYHYYRYQAR